MLDWKKEAYDHYPCWGRSWTLSARKSGRSVFGLTLQRERPGQPLTFFRIDFGLVGFGWMRAFSPKSYDGGWRCFANLYRGAPRALRWLLPAFGWSHQVRWFELLWSGSLAEPRAAWNLQIGHVFVGNETPAWLRRLAMARLAKELAAHGLDESGADDYCEMER